jgi:hypothetical protein
MEKAFQEDENAKHRWREDAKWRLPIGSRVRVVRSDVPEYIGAAGQVIGYDIGLNGDWPLVRVAFDRPVRRPHTSDETMHDGFYSDGDVDDEIVKMARCTCPWCPKEVAPGFVSVFGASPCCEDHGVFQPVNTEVK